MERIVFGDVIDVVLYYISLQPDMKKICLMDSHKFYELLEKTMKQWAETDKKAWGRGYYNSYYPSDQKKEKHDLIYDVAFHAWYSGPGPMGGTMGPAEHYAYLEAGFLQHDNLLILFTYPKEMADKGGTGNWPSYRKHNIERFTFPKWRHEMHAKRLEAVFHLAEMICVEMHKQKGGSNGRGQ
jgi:hypothetical protein